MDHSNANVSLLPQSNAGNQIAKSNINDRILVLDDAPTQKAQSFLERLNKTTVELAKSKMSSNKPLRYPMMSQLELDLILFARTNSTLEIERLSNEILIQTDNFVISDNEVFEQSLTDSSSKDMVSKVNRLNINAQPDHGGTALHHAAAYGHVEVIKLLLSLGADIDIQAPNGSTPLHWAAGNGQTEAVRLLLEKEANPYVCCCTIFPSFGPNWAYFLTIFFCIYFFLFCSQ